VGAEGLGFYPDKIRNWAHKKKRKKKKKGKKKKKRRKGKRKKRKKRKRKTRNTELAPSNEPSPQGKKKN